jgi:saccharopine dehydrogenase-like NADP-dependent oxidoreductase
MKRVTVLGAGKIGRTVVSFLDSSGAYDVIAADGDLATAEAAVTGLKHSRASRLDLADAALMQELLSGRDAVLSCLPYFCNPQVAELAEKHGCHYLDLTEDVAVTRKVKALAKNSKRAYIPQCGLAPGFITIVANHLMKRIDEVDSLRLRVGALPLNPANMLKYALSWSTDGLINEYAQPCEVITGGELREVLPLEGLEELTVGGTSYEAFNTSGGLGTLCQTLAGKLRELNYKSIRYPGHNTLIRFLMNDLRLADDRATLKRILERALPQTEQDVIVIFVSAAGHSGGRYLEQNYAHKITHRLIDGHNWTGIQVTTAAGICTALDLLLVDEVLPQQGFVRQEDISYELFLRNRFGRYYARDGELS